MLSQFPFTRRASSMTNLCARKNSVRFVAGRNVGAPVILDQSTWFVLRSITGATRTNGFPRITGGSGLASHSTSLL
jgi:hypothetical protein